MLSVYTRHSSSCPKKDDINWKRCRCPKWLDGTLNGERYRKASKTRSWEKAEALIRELEESDAPAVDSRRVTIAHAVSEYLQDAKDRGNGASTLSKKETCYRKQLLGWCKEKGYVYLDELGTPELRNWRSTWKMESLARFKRQAQVCGFFWFCHRQGWIDKNPMMDVGKIIVRQTPTDYFTREEFDAVIDATYLYRGSRWEDDDTFGTRLRAITLLMRWSGLAIRDAVTLERSRLIDDNVLLYRAKTGHPVFVPLPPDVAEELRNVPPGKHPHPAYFFWSGNGNPKSAVADWQRSYRRLFLLASNKLTDPTTGQMKRCHPHQFRDTFAVEMLLSGVSIEEVAMLLGHKSVKTTEKSYAPWVVARQEKLTESVRKAWERRGAA